MWKLTINKTIEEDYLLMMLPGLVKRVQKWKVKGVTGGKYKNMQKDLLPDWDKDNPIEMENLKILLTSKPKEAYEANKKLMKKFIKGYNERDLANKRLTGRYKNRLQFLERVFDYDGQISQSKSKSYWLAERIGHNTCTYCNRQYTFTIGGKNDQQRITRPAFDHWFPKSLFPLLSLNIYNLIPSCTVCNSGAKGDTIFHIGKFVHPYLQSDDDPKFKFVPQVSDTIVNSWHVVLSRDATANPEVDNTIKAFALDRIYDVHGPLEVKEIMEFAQAYNDTYLRDLYEKMKKDLQFVGYTQEEVYRMLFGTEAIASQFLDRPLSKLKHDILEYLHII